MQNFYENTTKINIKSYAAIYACRAVVERTVCDALAFACVVPLLVRLIRLIVRAAAKATQIPAFHGGDIWFFALLIPAILFLYRPMYAVRVKLQENRTALPVGARYHTIFFPDHVQMMEASGEMYTLYYRDVTWVRAYGGYVVLYLARQDCTLALDKKGFVKGTARQCKAFVKKAAAG